MADVQTANLLGTIKTVPASLPIFCGLDYDTVQADVLTSYAKGERRLRMETTRQYGKSTTAALLALYQAFTKPKSTILIFSIGLEEAKEVLFRLKELLTQMPILFPPVGDSKTELQLFNGSRIKCRSANASAGRGWTADLLIFDEAEYMPLEVFEGAQATLATKPDAGVLVISTVWSEHSWFWKLRSNTAYKTFTATADECSRISQEFLKEQEQLLRYEVFRAEYFCEPLTGNARLFPTHLWENKRVKDEKYVRMVRGWDMAVTADGGDYTCGVLLGERINGGYDIIDVVHGQWSSNVVEDTILNVAIQDGYDVTVIIPQDPGAGGKAWANILVKQLAGYMVETVLPKNKIQQAIPFSAQLQHGNIGLIDGVWNVAYVKQFSEFPEVAHDDMVDATCYGFLWLSGVKPKNVSKGYASAW